MATKNFCDVCKEELTEKELGGQLVYLDKVFSIPSSSAGVGSQPPQVKQVNVLLCEKCLEKIKKAIKI